jgi:hypothetical protein
MDPLEARDLYPITRQYIFMNHAGVSPMSERARLFNCGADHIALTRSTAHGLSLLAAGLDWQPGDAGPAGGPTMITPQNLRFCGNPE